MTDLTIIAIGLAVFPIAWILYLALCAASVAAWNVTHGQRR